MLPYWGGIYYLGAQGKVLNIYGVKVIRYALQSLPDVVVQYVTRLLSVCSQWNANHNTDHEFLRKTCLPQKCTSLKRKYVECIKIPIMPELGMFSKRRDYLRDLIGIQSIK